MRKELDDLQTLVEDVRSNYDDSEGKEEIIKDVKKCIKILEKWGG